ncbi:restriction endonuclease subunit S [Lysobacter zhanggongensis]|uniref:Restriction endonuclease subunit S n=1 Tax=Lysobacter zhanggongensis TaxID=1774951 RepID=A0ABU7YPE5_9GAMM
MAKQGAKTAVPRLRFPEFVGKPFREVHLKDLTSESITRNVDGLSTKSVMGVTKAEGIVPMEERLIASDIARYKVVQKDWFAYNPMRLNIGSIARWQGDSDILVSPDYVVFQCSKGLGSEIAPAYLDHFRQSGAWEKFVTEGGDGSVRVRIYYKDLARLQVTLPSLAEQKKIADCLTSLDEVIAVQGCKVEALKAHKRGLMQQLFPREGETRPRLRFPEFRDAPEWKWTTLNRVCDMQAGKFVSASEISDEPGEGTYSCYGGNGLRGFTKSFTHSGVFPLIGRQGALCGNVQFAKGEFHATEHALVATPQAGVNVTWLYYTLGKLELNKYATGQAQPGLSVDVLKSVECSVPATETEQKRIADCLSSLDTRITAEADLLATLKTHKQGLMQQLFPAPEATCA